MLDIPFLTLLKNKRTKVPTTAPVATPDFDPDSVTISPRPALPTFVSTTDHDPNSVSITRRPAQPLLPIPAAPKSRLEMLQEEQASIMSSPTTGRGGKELQKKGRLRNFLEGFLGAAGTNANRAMAIGNVGWGGVAQALGGGVGGGGVQAADPGIELKRRHEQAAAEVQSEIDKELQNQTNVAKIGDINARAEGREAAASAKERDLNLKEKGLDQRNEYYMRSVDLREKVLENKIDFDTWKKEQKKLDDEFRQTKFDETVRHNKATEGIGAQNAESNRIRALKPPAGAGDAEAAYARADELQRQLDELDALDAKEPSYKPIIDSKTGDVVTDDKGNPKYGTNRTEAYEERQARKKVLLAEKERLYSEARKAQAKSKTANSSAAEPAAPTQEFSISKWKAANPNGDVNAAIAKAKKLNYSIVN